MAGVPELSGSQEAVVAWMPVLLHAEMVFACPYREALSFASPAVPCGHMEESEAHNGAWLHYRVTHSQRLLSN